MKRIFSIIIFFAVAFSLFVPVLASDGEKYRITIESNEDEAVFNISPEMASVGSLVYVYADPLPEKRIKRGKFESEAGSGSITLTSENSFRFFMPAADTTVYVEYEAKIKKYSVTIKSSDEPYLEIETDEYEPGEPIKFAPGEIVTVKTHSDNEKFVSDVNYKFYYYKNYYDIEDADEEENGTFTFRMPEFNVILEANYEYYEKEYKVDVNYEKEQGSVEKSKGNAKEGETVYFYIEPKAGYAIDEVYFFNEEESEFMEYEYDSILDRYSVTMPASRIDLTVDFKKISIYKQYTAELVYDGEFGEVELSEYEARKDSKVYIYVSPERGAELESIKIKPCNSDIRVRVLEDDGEYYFNMPEDDVTVSVEFAEKYEGAVEHFKEKEEAEEETDSEPEDTEAETEEIEEETASESEDVEVETDEYSEPDIPVADPQVHICPARAYSDIDVNAWYHEAVDYVITAGLMGGYSENTFAPNDTTTRAMIATVLWRMENSPAPTIENPFSDVMPGTWYTDAVVWAAQKGIVNGIGGDKFNPDGEITREQLAAMVYRYAMNKGGLLFGERRILAYPDAGDTSDWALEAVKWCNSNGIIHIREEKLMPNAPAMRAEVAFAMSKLVIDN